MGEIIKKPFIFPPSFCVEIFYRHTLPPYMPLKPLLPAENFLLIKKIQPSPFKKNHTFEKVFENQPI